MRLLISRWPLSSLVLVGLAFYVIGVVFGPGVVIILVHPSNQVLTEPDASSFYLQGGADIHAPLIIEEFPTRPTSPLLVFPPLDLGPRIKQAPDNEREPPDNEPSREDSLRYSI